MKLDKIEFSEGIHGTKINLQSTALRKKVIDTYLFESIGCPSISKEFVETSLITLFERQAAQTPDATALVFEDQSLTYAELNQRANQLAHYLRSVGAQPEQIIGIGLPRSLDMAISLLAILKTGAAFLPLDINYPAAHLQHMLETSQAPLVITTSDTSLYGSLSSTQFICIDELQEDLIDLPVTSPDVFVNASQLAYVLYTSGSTGRPKGVAVAHQQILNRLHWMWQAYPFAAHEVACQKTALNFVDAIWEFLGPLLKGIPTVILSDMIVQNPTVLIEQLARHQVSRIWLVPSLLRALLNTETNIDAALPQLTFWVATGEALPTTLYEQFQTQAPHAVLYNLYGTTEVWDATWFDPSKETQLLSTTTVPIGRPIANTSVYIVDQQLQPLPIGVPGELHIGGAGLARGYLNRSELTQEKFINNPFGQGRLYKTGDLARYLEDGTIEYLGRIDYQVKVRGFRIELGEIETALTHLPQIKEAAVVTREDVPGDNRLVAYVVVHKDFVDVSTETLSKALHSTLPEYMIPNVFITLDQLPLTPNGKIDRKALQNKNLSQLFNKYANKPPDTNIEKRLVKVFEDQFKLKIESVHQNFFDLGITSLSVITLRKQIEDIFKKELMVTELFEYPTINTLANKICGKNESYLFLDIYAKSLKWRQRVQSII